VFNPSVKPIVRLPAVSGGLASSRGSRFDERSPPA
jgi:hypothetical protein